MPKKSEMFPKSTAKKAPYRKYKKSAKTGTALMTTIKKAIARQAEVKSWFSYAANQSILTANVSVPSSVLLIPQINQGTGHSNRIGNQIRIVKAVVRGHVNILPYNIATNPIVPPVYVKMRMC